MTAARSTWAKSPPKRWRWRSIRSRAGPGADAVLKAAGVIGEDEAKPLGPLAGLKDKLAGR